MIPMNVFNREPESLVQAEISAVERVIRSGRWILGREVEEFESDWSNRIGVSNTVGVANGLDAIEIGLRVLGIGIGDEVITTSMTAYATALAIIRTGATPVLADIDTDTAILSLDSVKRCLSSKTKAVVLVHLYGQTGPADEFRSLCDNYGIHLLEDCAQAHGAKLNGKSVGTFGTVSAWSFYPTKNLGAVGDGGALTTDVDELAEKARVLRNYGQSERYHHPVIGMNSRLDEVQAAILKVRLAYIDEWIRKRREIASKYDLEIDNSYVKIMPAPLDKGKHVRHLYVIKSSRRDELITYLRNRNISSLIHYPICVHFQAAYPELPRDPAGLTVAEEHSHNCLSLPCHPFLKDEEMDYIIETVNCYKPSI